MERVLQGGTHIFFDKIICSTLQKKRLYNIFGSFLEN